MKTHHIVIIVLACISIPIIGGIMVVGGLGFVAYQSMEALNRDSQEDGARMNIRVLEQACKTFKLDAGRMPVKLEELINQPPDLTAKKWRGPYLQESTVPLDPWGNAYLYKADEDQVFILSSGPDGENGTSDDLANKPPM